MSYFFIVMRSNCISFDLLFFFFFKQKTAYEMRISDWSSDVCSSDLTLSDPILEIHMGETAENVAERYGISRADQDALAVEGHRRAAQAIAEGRFKKQIEIGRASCRERVGQYV